MEFDRPGGAGNEMMRNVNRQSKSKLSNGNCAAGSVSKELSHTHIARADFCPGSFDCGKSNIYAPCKHVFVRPQFHCKMRAFPMVLFISYLQKKKHLKFVLQILQIKVASD